jgi:hypothetical protein
MLIRRDESGVIQRERRVEPYDTPTVYARPKDLLSATVRLASRRRSG